MKTKLFTSDYSVERQTVEQVMASADRTGGKTEKPMISPEEEREIVHETLTDHYTRVLDEVVPPFGNTTPRKAVKSAKGREKVIVWLKMLENHSAQQPAGDPMADYDFGWLWEQLGLGDQRER